MVVTAIAGFALPLRRQDSAPPSPAVVALGDSVFHGKVGGALCYVCH